MGDYILENAKEIIHPPEAVADALPLSKNAYKVEITKRLIQRAVLS